MNIPSTQAPRAFTGALTLDEAAKMLRVSRRFLQLEIKRGKLRVIRLSAKATRVRLRDLEDYLNKAEEVAK